MGMAPEIPLSLRTLMAEIGPRWGVSVSAHVKLMVEEFSAVHRLDPRSDIEVRRDIAYGAHPRQQLDVYLPRDHAKDRPAAIFVHGGAFVDGHRNRTGEIYSNIPVYFARHGIAGINVGYRLAPEAQFPSASRDIGAALAWVRDHASEFGIDPARLFLMGHSAGGAHAGTYAYDSRVHSQAGPGIAGLIIVSGRVRADNLAENPNARKVETYYGTDAARFDECSPVTHVSAQSVPTFVAWGEYENPLIDVYCAELVYRLAAAKRRGPPMVWLKGHNHTSTIGHIGTTEDTLGAAIRAFIWDPR